MKREYTKFGEELKVLRTRRHQSIQDMADVLGAEWKVERKRFQETGSISFVIIII